MTLWPKPARIEPQRPRRYRRGRIGFHGGRFETPPALIDRPWLQVAGGAGVALAAAFVLATEAEAFHHMYAGGLMWMTGLAGCVIGGIAWPWHRWRLRRRMRRALA